MREVETDAEADAESDVFVSPSSYREDSEVVQLRAALQECWTLCNTLATLSSVHRERMFNTSGTPNAYDRAWKCCWKLCQRLYNNYNYHGEHADVFDVWGNLDLCRDFCQSLFECRPRHDEKADSVLRVSFELNNQYVMSIKNTFIIIINLMYLVFTRLRTRAIFLKSSRNGLLNST